MTWISIALIIVGLSLFVWNVYHHPERRVDGSSVSLLFMIFLGVAILTDPAKITLPFVSYEKQVKNEVVKIQNITKASEELFAIQKWNSGRLLDDTHVVDKNSDALATFKKLYGSQYKNAIKGLVNENKLFMTEKEFKDLGLKDVENTIQPFSTKLNSP